MKHLRKRLKGWSLKRFIERRRYWFLMKRRRRHKRRKRGVAPIPAFQQLSGDSQFLTIVDKVNYTISVGGSLVRCPKGSLIIQLPQVFDFDKNYSESAQVIVIFRRALRSGRRISYIDFERVQEVSPSCMMVFSAYAEIWKTHAPKVQTKTQTWNPEVARRFSEIGFFKMLGFPEPPNISPNGEIKFMPIKSSPVYLSSKADIGHDAANLQRSVEAFIERSLDDVRMYDSVTEAVYNVWNHAYKGVRVGRLLFKWWVSVSYDLLLNELRVIIFDYGLGIPTTMKTSTKFAAYRKLLGGTWSESYRLYLAFERERKRRRGIWSMSKGRGYGCPDIARLVEPSEENKVREGSSLTVISGKARYVLDGRQRRGQKEDLSVKLQGTLIEWRMRL